MITRKLEALGYHSVDTFSISNEATINSPAKKLPWVKANRISSTPRTKLTNNNNKFPTIELGTNDEKHFKTVVLWLEDQVIRHYKIEDRAKLRDLDSPKWSNVFEEYCKDLECPLSPTSPNECLEWIAGYAVRLEYSDNREKYQNQTAEAQKNAKNSNPVIKSSNPLDSLDFQSEEFKKGVNDLAALLNVTPHPNHLITLEAICSLITRSLDKSSADDPKPQGAPFPIMEMDLGFDLGDYVLNRAAKILRLLYIHDLRDLQTKINEAIVSVQVITANPKTDTKLGKVGY